MPYKDKDYYIPPTKEALVEWISQHYWTMGQTAQGLNRMDKRRLMAIYMSIRERIK